MHTKDFYSQALDQLQSDILQLRNQISVIEHKLELLKQSYADMTKESNNDLKHLVSFNELDSLIQQLTSNGFITIELTDLAAACLLDIFIAEIETNLRVTFEKFSLSKTSKVNWRFCKFPTGKNLVVFAASTSAIIYATVMKNLMESGCLLIIIQGIPDNYAKNLPSYALTSTGLVKL